MTDAGARFADTVTIVTGSSRGIGLAIAARLVAEGGRVVLTGRRREPLEAAAAQLGPAATAVAGAADDPVHRAEVFAHVARTHGRLDHLVNNTGINPVYGPLASVDVAAARKILEVNVVAALEWSRDAVAAGLTRSIVNIASVAAFDGQIGQAAYSSSKGGVVGMTLPVARDLSAAGIRLNTIAPGLIDTPIYGEGEASEAFKAKLGESVLFPKRLGQPAELASMVIELITNSYMNAEVVRVDGGIRMPPK